MRKHINSKSQTGLIAALNRTFGEFARLNWFATAVVATYLAGKARLSVCNAGHPTPLWHRSRDSTWKLLTKPDNGPARAANLPLGIDEDSKYDIFHVDLDPKDVIVLYTDAFVEARPAGGGAPLGEDGLLELARSCPTDHPREFGKALLAAVEKRFGETPKDDDATLLVLKHEAGPPKRLSIKEKVDVYAKVFGLKKV